MLNSSVGAGNEWQRGRKRWLPAGALQSVVVDEDEDVDDEDDDDGDEQLNETYFCLRLFPHPSHTPKVVLSRVIFVDW